MRSALAVILCLAYFLLQASSASVFENLYTRGKTIPLKGIWVDKNTIALQDQGGGVYDYVLNANGVNAYPLKYMGFAQPQNNEEWKKQFFYLVSDRYQQFQIDLPIETITQVIKGPIIINKMERSTRRVVETFSVSLTGLLDREFAYTGPDLGLTFKDGVPTFRLWAPTAKRVALKLFRSPSENDPLMPAMELVEGDDHVWSIKGDRTWKNAYYKYEIENFKRRLNEYTTESVTDIYSVNLSMNSLFSQVVDIENDIFPAGWKEHKLQFNHPVNDFSDVALYELHIRDFSVFDFTQKAEERGKFLAFTNQEANGVRHLKDLAKAGITHLHLLPFTDISSIDENPAERSDLSEDDFRYLDSLFGSSPEPQNIATRIRTQDAFNWGYDPYHYMALEGSYSSNPKSTARILEFRKMVMSLHAMGLGVVQDAVFNHYSGLGDLDMFVPDYYYSLNSCGDITKDSCCNDLATENKMVQRLIVDSALNFVRWYRLDGIRLDLMGFLTKSVVREMREKLNRLTLKDHGIDGKKVLLYGEGWSFGPLLRKLPNEAVTQGGAVSMNMGIGTFNDSFRDAVKGKGQNSNDLFVDDAFITDKLQNREAVLSGLFGSIRGFKYGYMNQPYESINYLTAHDKNTLWDTLMAKVGPYASTDRVVRIQQLGLSLLTFAQGIPFYHAGEEILRSKSGDENSYDSGDWFNRLDFTYQTNGWNSGLPPQFVYENNAAWTKWKERLEYVSAPQPAHIRDTLAYFKDLLSIRFSSKLFHLSTREQILAKMTLPASIYDRNGNFEPKLVAMKIDDNAGVPVDSQFEKAWVLFNNSWDRCTYYVDRDLISYKVELHPVLKASSNRYTREDQQYVCPSYNGQAEAKSVIAVPPQTTLVYIKRK